MRTLSKAQTNGKQNGGEFLFFRTLHNASFSNLEVAERQRIAFESDTLPTNNLVLIIDESIRSDHLSINGYARPTTPYLHTISDKGYLYNWGTAVAGGSCSMISNPLLITGIPVTENARLFADEYSVLSIKLRRLKQQSESAPPLVDLTPTLFDYAKAMGYRTHYLDTQTRYLWNGLGLRDLDFIDHWLTIDDFGDDVDSDFRAADYIYQTVKSSNGNFILLNKRGVHFRYDESFPADQMIWSPPPPKWDYREYPEFGINVYDSGIRYNVNTFFQRMLPDFETLENTIFIYTSDHGQTLFEDGLQWPHCGATNKEAMVPLLLIGDVEQTLDTQFPASHSNIFSSFLDLMAVPEAVRAYPYAPSLLTARADSRADRLFLTGVFSIINFDDTVSPQN
ncbi:MAG: sulfatase-like hydrolase/transferase [Chloroflexota bacterium]